MIRSFISTLVALLMTVHAAFAAVEIQEVTSKSGIKAWLVEEHSIPFVALEIRFKGGASLDAEGKRGAINLMTALLEEGSGDMDAQAFAQARDALAADFSFDVSDDSLQISARFLTDTQDEAIALLRQALLKPLFKQSAIDRVKSQVQSIIVSDLKDPNSIASETFARLAYGQHPYASSINGTQQSVAALTQADFFEAKDKTMALDRLYVGASGDITPEALSLLLDDLLFGLPENGAPMPAKVTRTLQGGVTVVPFETPQSVTLFGHGGLNQDDPDFFAAFILNTILGGSGFEARLMKEVREERGLTYGIGSYLVPKDYAAMYLGQVSSANDRIAEAVEVTKQVWADMAKNGVSEDELTRAQTYLTGAYPLRFDGNGPIANIMVGMQMQDLPVDYIPTRNDKVEAVTLEDVNRVAANLLRADDLHFVVVGQPVGLQSTN
jgi:zinc protease